MVGFLVMEEGSRLSIQNIIGRITHGLIGMDIFLSKKVSNAYLKDFLTLKEDEIRQVFLSSSAQKRLIPPHEVKLSAEESSFLDCVKNAQKLVTRIDQVKSDREIEACLNDLGSKMDVIYAVISER
jgi:hypothetical protein